MTITKQNTQTKKPVATPVHYSEDNVLSVRLKEKLMQPDDTQEIVLNAAQLSRLLDACGDCV